MPLVRIDIGTDHRASLGKEVGEIVYRAMREEIFISLVEVNKENWSFGNGEMQYGLAA